MGFETEKAGAFHLLCRYFQNVQGSGIDIHLDGTLITTVDTRHQINSFVWEEIGLLDLDEGHHRLTMRSKGGLNAVNVFLGWPATVDTRDRSMQRDLALTRLDHLE